MHSQASPLHYRSIYVALVVAGLFLLLSPCRSAASSGKMVQWEVARVADILNLTIPVAEERMQWQERAPRLQAMAREQLGSHFGELWIDPDNGVVTLGVAGLSPEVKAKANQLVAQAGLQSATEIVAVERSSNDLSQIWRWLRSRIDAENEDSAHPLAFGIRPDQNAAQISAPSYPLTEKQQALVDEAKDRFGAGILLGQYLGVPVARACSYPYCTPPLRAGVKIGTSSTWKCTAGFLARGQGLDSNLYQLTAGHCGSATWGTKLGASGSWESIGQWKGQSIGGEVDAGKYLVANDSIWNARPWVYWAGTHEGYPTYSDADPLAGQTVCTNGAFYGSASCGQVKELKHVVGGLTVVRASFCGTGGDSGSPVFANNVALGLQQGGYGNPSCDSFFIRARAAESALAVDIRHESQCDPLFESPVKLGDMTGDGKEDIFQFIAGAEGKTYGWESKGSSYTGLGSIGTGFGSQYQNRVGDMDGDGDDDLFQMTDNGDLYAWESKGSSYTYLGKIGSGFGSACDTRVANIDGDSKVDILRFTNDGYAYGWLANEGKYVALGQIGTGFGSTYQDRSGDMDGDGDDDLFQILDNGDVYRWTSNGSTFTQQGGGPFSGVGNASQVRFADTEGDGDDDLFRFTDAGVGTLWKSKGTAYEAIGTIATGLGVTRQMRVADIDGDGDADILKFADDGNGYAWKFNGSTYESIGKIGSGFGAP